MKISQALREADASMDKALLETHFNTTCLCIVMSALQLAVGSYQVKFQPCPHSKILSAVSTSVISLNSLAKGKRRRQIFE